MSGDAKTQSAVGEARGLESAGAGIGAREIGAAAACACLRRRSIVAIGASPAQLRSRLLGVDAGGKVSPLAKDAGYRFQSSVLDGDAMRLRAASCEHGLAPLDRCVDSTSGNFRSIVIEPGCADPYGVTDSWMRDGGGGVVLLSEAHLRLRVGRSVHTIRPDLLIGDLDSGTWRVGEIKSALDRGGRTDPVRVARACMQMAVGAVAAEQALGSRGRVVPEGDLVLRARRKGGLSIHRLDLQGEIRAVRHFLSEAQDLAQAHSAGCVDEVLSIPCKLTATCPARCEMAAVCLSAEGALSTVELGRDWAVIEEVGGLDSAIAACTSDSCDESGAELQALRAGFALARKTVGL